MKKLHQSELLESGNGSSWETASVRRESVEDDVRSFVDKNVLISRQPFRGGGVEMNIQ